MSEVECVGNESRLIDCPYAQGGSGNLVTMECSYYCKPLFGLVHNTLRHCSIKKYMVGFVIIPVVPTAHESETPFVSLVSMG